MGSKSRFLFFSLLELAEAVETMVQILSSRYHLNGHEAGRAVVPV